MAGLLAKQDGGSLWMQAVAFVRIEGDHAFTAQAFQHFTDTEKGQGNVQVQQVTVHATHTQAAVALGGRQ